MIACSGLLPCCSAAGLDSQEWYRELFTFGASQEAANGRHQQADADEELIPRLVQELALPLAMHAVRHVWNPFSRRSTKALAAVLEEMMVYAPADNPKLQASDTGWQSASMAHLLLFEVSGCSHEQQPKQHQQANILTLWV